MEILLDLERERKQVIYVFGPFFDCYGKPWEGCLSGLRFKAYQEPCLTCVNKYGKHLLERVH
jgi:hypothetical protein